MGGKGDHIVKQLALGEMAVSDLRPEDRGEALVVTVQGRDGTTKTWVDPIRRDATGGVSFGQGNEFDHIGGRFGRLFR
jgi:hypothetical protein